MKTSQIAVLVIAIAGGLFGLSPDAAAGGAGDPFADDCTTTSPAGQSLTGSAAVVYHNLPFTVAEFAEVTVALQREAAGTPEFFRRIIGPILVLTPQGVTCQILAFMGNEILIRFYGSAAGRTLKILDNSITESDGHQPLNPDSPELGHSALVNVRILVQSP